MLLQGRCDPAPSRSDGVRAVLASLEEVLGSATVHRANVCSQGAPRVVSASPADLWGEDGPQHREYSSLL